MQHVFKVHPGCSMYKYIIVLHGWIVFQWKDMPQLFIHLPAEGHLSCVHLLIVVNAAMSTCVQVFVWTNVSNFFEYIPSSQIIGLFGNPV